MNCAGVRKFIYAFADNQLGVKESCEVLDHLKLCPECSRLVDEHQSLRRAIGRQCEEVAAPTALRSRLIRAIDDPGAPSIVSGRTGRPVWGRYVSAACLLIAAGGLVWWGLPRDGGASPAGRITSVPRGESAASSIAEVHTSCCAHHEMHQSKNLPRNLREIAPALRDHFEDKIAALAPDLSRYGFAFESVNLCGVRNKPGCEGGHIIYIRSGGQRLSFFSVPRWDCLDHCGRATADPAGDLREYSVDLDGGGRLNILAWHRHATTYICCAGIDAELLEDMVQTTRLAIAEFDREIRLAWAVRGR